jgi:hypothetical protein
MDAAGPSGADLMVLKLKGAAPAGLNPFPLYPSGDEKGAEFTLIGWGDRGPAPHKPDECAARGASCEQLLAGRNVFSAATCCNVLEYTFDRPGEGDGLPTEAVATAGDSGGPAFIKARMRTPSQHTPHAQHTWSLLLPSSTQDEATGRTFLAGVNSGGDCCECTSLPSIPPPPSSLLTPSPPPTPSSSSSALPPHHHHLAPPFSERAVTKHQRSAPSFYGRYGHVDRFVRVGSTITREWVERVLAASKVSLSPTHTHSSHLIHTALGSLGCVRMCVKGLDRRGRGGSDGRAVCGCVGEH